MGLLSDAGLVIYHDSFSGLMKGFSVVAPMDLDGKASGMGFCLIRENLCKSKRGSSHLERLS